MALQDFPPGFRFEPTEIELVDHYLQNKISNRQFNSDKIVEENIYAYHPGCLITKYRSNGEDAWYFFSSRKRKYRNGQRPDRKAGEGYWKASGKTEPIKDKNGVEIGHDTGLVYYEKARDEEKQDVKTDWIMHEYWSKKYQLASNDQNMMLDEWVICKIYKSMRSRVGNKKSEEVECSPSPGPHPWLQQSNETVEMENPNRLAKRTRVKIQEDLVEQAKPLEETPKRRRKEKGIAIEDGVEGSRKPLKTALKHSPDELPSSDFTYKESSSCYMGYQHAYPLNTYSQNTTNFGGVYGQSTHLYDNQNVPNVYDQGAFLYASNQNILNCVGVYDQNAYLSGSIQIDGSGFGQNIRDQITKPSDGGSISDVVFDVDVDDKALNELLEKFGGSGGNNFPSDQEYNGSEPNGSSSEAGDDLLDWGNSGASSEAAGDLFDWGSAGALW
ncbi:hypothetical protein ACHQM5_019472 [Ranunculus cassubicifolius]